MRAGTSASLSLDDSGVPKSTPGWKNEPFVSVGSRRL